MRKALIAVVLAVFVAAPFAVGTPQANAQDEGCTQVGPAVVCAGQEGGVNVDGPLVHVCIRLNSVCP